MHVDVMWVEELQDDQSIIYIDLMGMFPAQKIQQQ